MFYVGSKMIAQSRFIVEIWRLIVHRELVNSISCFTRKLPELIGSMYNKSFVIRGKISAAYSCENEIFLFLPFTFS